MFLFARVASVDLKQWVSSVNHVRNLMCKHSVGNNARFAVPSASAGIDAAPNNPQACLGVAKPAAAGISSLCPLRPAACLERQEGDRRTIRGEVWSISHAGGAPQGVPENWAAPRQGQNEFSGQGPRDL